MEKLAETRPSAATAAASSCFCCCSRASTKLGGYREKCIVPSSAAAAALSRRHNGHDPGGKPEIVYTWTQQPGLSTLAERRFCLIPRLTSYVQPPPLPPAPSLSITAHCSCITKKHSFSLSLFFLTLTLWHLLGVGRSSALILSAAGVRFAGAGGVRPLLF